MFPGALLTAALFLNTAGLSEAELGERAAAEFSEGVRLRGAADQARPHFRAAAGYFDELRRRGANNLALYRNLGNAYLLADDLPHAILSYRRGLQLAPNDAALRESLNVAREQVVYPAQGDLGRPVPDLRPPWLPHVRPRGLFVVAVVLYGLACVSLTRWRMVRRGRLLTFGAGSLLAAAVLAVLVVAEVRSADRESAGGLVVIAEDGVLLRRGNNLAFPPRYETPLNRGVEARLLFERGDWLQIELAGGEVGWVPRAYALVDGP